MPDLSTPELVVVLAFACAGVVVIGAFIWIFIFGRSFSAIVMMIVGIIMNANDEKSIDENAPIEMSDEHSLGQVMTRRTRDIPFEAQVPNVHVKESLASQQMQPRGPINQIHPQTNPHTPVHAQNAEDTAGEAYDHSEAEPADPRGFLHERLRPSDAQIDQDAPQNNQE